MNSINSTRQSVKTKMNSTKETLIISTQKNLVQNDQAKQTRIKNTKSIIFFFFLILFIIIGSSMLFPSMQIKTLRPEKHSFFQSGSSWYYYCHFTLYPDLCYDSMSSIINTTALKPAPGPIFSASLQLAINELKSTAISITKTLSSSTSSGPLAGPRLSMCQKSVHDSLSRLNKSLGLLGFDLDIESLTYKEIDSLMAWGGASMKDVRKCFLAMEEIDDMMVAKGGEDEKIIMGVEEVKLGVEKAKKLIANSIYLFDRRESILDADFYSPSIDIDYEYSYDYNFLIGYRFVIGMYSLMYLVLAFLYFLIWTG